MNYYIDDYIKTYKDTTLAINKAIEDQKKLVKKK